MHLGHVTTGFATTPGGRGLLATATTEAGIAMLHANFAAGDLSDLGAMQRHAGHVLHALASPTGTGGPGLGYGLIRAVEDVAVHIEMAARASDASDGVETHASHITTIARTVKERAEEAAEIARRLQVATSIRRASPLVAQLPIEITYLGSAICS